LRIINWLKVSGPRVERRREEQILSRFWKAKLARGFAVFSV